MSDINYFVFSLEEISPDEEIYNFINFIEILNTCKQSFKIYKHIEDNLSEIKENIEVNKELLKNLEDKVTDETLLKNLEDKVKVTDETLLTKLNLIVSNLTYPDPDPETKKTVSLPGKFGLSRMRTVTTVRGLYNIKSRKKKSSRKKK